jgi:hypothetical protein
VLLKEGNFDLRRVTRTNLFTLLEYPTLRHFTCHLACPAYTHSECRISAPNLTSLHLVLDHIFLTLWSSNLDFTTFVPELPLTLESYTVSGNNNALGADQLFWCIMPILKYATTLPLLRIQDLTLNVDISEAGPELEDDLRIDLLIFDNVTYCLHDEITLSGPSDPKDPDHRCKPFATLIRHANSVCIISRTVEATVDIEV